MRLALNTNRIKRLYVKDLLDILRDRRTLITLVAVPLVLYPLLMLCFIQLGSIQADEIKEQCAVLGVDAQDPGMGEWLDQVLRLAKALAEQARLREAPPEAVPTALRDWVIRVVPGGPQALQGWVQRGEGHCALECVVPPEQRAVPQTLALRIFKDSAEIRSETAAVLLEQILRQFEQRERDRRALAAGVPIHVLHPVSVASVDVASAVKRGGSLLGQILPLVLVLMTITGAIYPAIDVTAGERERGTLETLVVCPVPVSEIIIAKFLVVGTVSMIGAALNLASMGLTIHFGGLRQALATTADTQVPIGILPVILLCLIPLSLLFSALLVAVSSFAKSFKEAQSYVTPVIMGVLLPAGIAALPGTELAGVNTVIPVANMVLLTRELLLGTVAIGTTLAVVLSTCFYAATAVVIAMRVFGQEAVLFADAGSWRAMFDRQLIQPSAHPPAALPLLYVSLLFPAWLYAQNALESGLGHVPALALVLIEGIMAVLFVVLPLLIVVYLRIDVANTFQLRRPPLRFLLGGGLLGLGTWVVAHELIVVQARHGLFGLSQRWIEQLAAQEARFQDLPAFQAIVLLAVVPAMCEEFLFRGLLLSGLQRAMRKWGAIFAVGVIFAVFHFLIQRLVVTFCLGVLLAWLCVQSRSIIPAMLLHLMHNAITLAGALPFGRQRFQSLLGLPPQDSASLAHLPPWILVAGLAAVAAGVVVSIRPSAMDRIGRRSPAAGPQEQDSRPLLEE